MAFLEQIPHPYCERDCVRVRACACVREHERVCAWGCVLVCARVCARAVCVCARARAHVCHVCDVRERGEGGDAIVFACRT